MHNSNPPHYNCKFAYIGYLTQTNLKHDQSTFPDISVSQILHFVTQIVLRFVPSAAVDVFLRYAHGMSDKQFVYVDSTVFFDLKSLLPCFDVFLTSLRVQRSQILICYALDNLMASSQRK